MMGLTAGKIVESGRDPASPIHKITLSQVNTDLATVQKVWLTLSMRDHQSWLGEMLARLEHLIAECWEGWERSKTTRKIETKRVAQGLRGKGEGSKEIIVREEAQAGDPAFLEQIGKNYDRISKLVGLDVSKIALTSPDGRTPYDSFGLALTDVERAEKVAALLDRARARAIRPLATGATSEMATLPGTSDGGDS